jgi:hypothetical protein
MDLIAQVIGAVLAFFAGIIGNILAHDVCASANAVCAKIIKAAAARLAPFDRHSTEQEWLADLQERETVVEQYRHAVGCFLAAPSMRRCALETPFVGDAPGLVWYRARRGDGVKVWAARWRYSPKAEEAGYKTKSVLLWHGDKRTLTAENRERFIEIIGSLQAEQDRWLNDPDYRMQLDREAAESEQKIQSLIALGYTRADACDALYGPKQMRKLRPEEILRPLRKPRKRPPLRP